MKSSSKRWAHKQRVSADAPALPRVATSARKSNQILCSIRCVSLIQSSYPSLINSFRGGICGEWPSTYTWSRSAIEWNSNTRDNAIRSGPCKQPMVGNYAAASSTSNKQNSASARSHAKYAYSLRQAQICLTLTTLVCFSLKRRPYSYGPTWTNAWDSMAVKTMWQSLFTGESIIHKFKMSSRWSFNWTNTTKMSRRSGYLHRRRARETS